MRITSELPYEYRNCPIPGGGYVTGFTYHPTDERVLYCRTDIGGVYRYDYNRNCWVSLINHVTMLDLNETYPAALALDPKDSSIIYIACGYSDWRKAQPGALAVSHDYGEHFEHYPLPCVVHGNMPGRGAGPRMVVDPLNSDILYLASQRIGLIRSKDRGKHWEPLSVEDATLYGQNEPEDTFVCVRPLSTDTASSSVLILGTIGTGNLTKNGKHYTPDTSLPPWEAERSHEVGCDLKRGHSLYVSYNAGASWEPLTMPESPYYSDCKISGLVGFRADCDEHFLYITCHATGPKARHIMEAYSCDCVGLCDGRVLRYPILPDGRFGEYEDITPIAGPLNYTKEYGVLEQRKPCGFGGISTTPSVPGLLIVATLSEKRGDIIFRSFDYGSTWEPILYGLNIGQIKFHTPYMKTEHNGGYSLIHWLSDLRINPHNSLEALFTTGTGVFATANLLGSVTCWEDRCTGIEETVHLTVYSPPKGDVQVIDIVGDLGGFAFTDLTKPCEDSFNDGCGNRYITCINADFPENDPDTVLVTARGNWTGKTIGGLILSKDQCKTWKHLDLPFGLSEYTDSLLSEIARPNRNPGWAAISSDGRNIVWSMASGLELPMNAVVYSHDGGQSFALSVFKNVTEPEKLTVKVFSDRIHPDYFYAFGWSNEIYVSEDGGAHFIPIEVPKDFPHFRFSLIDTADSSSICPVPGQSGIFFLSMEEHGLYEMRFDWDTYTADFTLLSLPSEVFFKIGLGVGLEGDYYNGRPSLYAAAILDNEYGFYRSDDYGEHWIRINQWNQMYGQIIAICGDARKHGRFYIATGSRGLLYGEPQA